MLHQLRDEGFTVAIDDFGTGYSSLTHLKHFPIDTLKIDISFIADLETDPQDAAITEAIIGLARGLGLKVVAEGVGTREQLDFLDAARLRLLPGLLGQQAAAGGCVLRVRAPTSRAAADARLSARAGASLGVEARQASRRSAFATSSHAGSSISMCAMPGQDRGRDAVMRARWPRRRRVCRCDRRARPARTPAVTRAAGSRQCSRSDRSNSARGDSRVAGARIASRQDRAGSTRSLK